MAREIHTSRTSPTASATFPIALRLAHSASYEPRPSRSSAACRSARCVSISSRRSASCRERRSKCRSLRRIVFMTPEPSGRPQHTLDRADHAIELSEFGGELPAARGGERVVARAAVVLRRTPLGLYPVVEQQPLERGIQRTLADCQNIIRRQPQVLDDAVAVFGSAPERFQN